MSKKFKDEDICVRAAKATDMVSVADMIQELANYEKMPDGPKLSVEDLQHDGFETQPPAFKCKVAELTPSGPIVGYALYFPTYSTWEGKAMMLEDLYVRKNCRRRGVGSRLFYSVVLESSKYGCSRLDFHVLAWNDARTFYEDIGAKNLTETEQWCYYRLSGDALMLASISQKESDSA